MSAAKHTAGLLVKQEDDPHRTFPFALVTHAGTVVALVQRREDAHAFATAPELLEALYAIAGDSDGQHADPLRTLANILGMARAAIAKATGSAS